MTTYTATGPGIVTTDVDFRARVSEYAAMLDAVGLERTTDTGQLDLATVSRPASTSTMSGYLIWKFTDSLASVAPIYIKVEFGLSGSSTAIGFAITVGTGSDGAGNLSGPVTPRSITGANTAATSSSVSYACHTEGFLGVISKPYAIPSTHWGGGFSVCRTCDANGHPTADGAAIYMALNTPTGIAMRFDGSSPTVLPATFSSDICHFPMGVGHLVNGEVPCYPLWIPQPALKPTVGMLAYPQGLVATQDTIEIAMVGNTPRTYMMVYRGFQAGNSNIAYAILWE